MVFTYSFTVHICIQCILSITTPNSPILFLPEPPNLSPSYLKGCLLLLFSLFSIQLSQISAICCNHNWFCCLDLVQMTITSVSSQLQWPCHDQLQSIPLHPLALSLFSLPLPSRSLSLGMGWESGAGVYINTLLVAVQWTVSFSSGVW